VPVADLKAALGVPAMVPLTQAAYAALAVKDPNALYVVIG